MVRRGRDIDILSHHWGSSDAGGGSADQDESDVVALQGAQDL